jgi:demethylmenaquinone methyltransferase/2-methoxy-6-polyprenyl-1,4-benzoquinol methylase
MNNNEAFFDSVAAKWDGMVNHSSKKIYEVLEYLGIKSDDNILDIGTGTGVLIPFLLEHLGEEGKITAVDISAQMLKIARSKYDSNQVCFLKLDFLEAELQDNFDIAICYSCFPHFEDRRLAIKNMLKVLNNNGRLVIFHSESREKINQLHGNMDNHIKDDRLPSAEDLKLIIESEGGKVTYLEDSEEKYVLIAAL